MPRHAPQTAVQRPLGWGLPWASGGCTRPYRPLAGRTLLVAFASGTTQMPLCTDTSGLPSARYGPTEQIFGARQQDLP
jgi:hypothetical protein